MDFTRGGRRRRNREGPAGKEAAAGRPAIERECPSTRGRREFARRTNERGPVARASPDTTRVFAPSARTFLFPSARAPPN